MLVFFEMVSSLYQGALRIFKKNLIEIQYSALFISTVIVNKYVLTELAFREPTVFQGWQTFTCVLLLSAMVKCHAVAEEVKKLDRRTFFLMLPGFIFFTVSIVAGSKGLAILPVPLVCAVLSLNPAVLVLMDKKTDLTESLKQVCGSVTVCGTVIVILVITLNKLNTEAYLWQLGHVLLTIMYTLYMERISLEFNSITKIYFRNCFSIVVLLPVSVYLDVLYIPRGVSWKFYFGCILSGLLGTFLQMVTAKMEQMPTYMNWQGRAKLICSLIAHVLLFTNIEPIIWFLIMVNLLINSTLLSPDEFQDRKPKLTLVLGPPEREFSIERAVLV